MSDLPELSVVVPLYDEEDNVAPLVDAVASALGDRYAWELILVDDGSRDRTWERLLGAAEAEPRGKW